MLTRMTSDMKPMSLIIVIHDCWPCALGRRATRRELLNKVITEFNKTVSVKKWRVTTERKKLIANLQASSEGFRTIVARHYDRYAHQCSGPLFFGRRGTIQFEFNVAFLRVAL